MQRAARFCEEPCDAPYDPDNIFGKILRGEIPAHKVYEDEHSLAFMDVMPQGEGHTLVIPKAPARGLLDAEPQTLAALIGTVQRVGRAVKAAFDADGLTLFQYNEPAGGRRCSTCISTSCRATTACR
ncbi:hypothetical protein GCM10025880_19470 [Methylorubrum aminovorans]|nr:hypothetical protein GCM10025880_19470 [Methylorubrum aminovorans]